MVRQSDETRLPQPSSQARQMAGNFRDTDPASPGPERMPGRSSEDAPGDRGQRSVDRPRKRPPQACATTAED